MSVTDGLPILHIKVEPILESIDFSTPLINEDAKEDRTYWQMYNG